LQEEEEGLQGKRATKRVGPEVKVKGEQIYILCGAGSEDRKFLKLEGISPSCRRGTEDFPAESKGGGKKGKIRSQLRDLPKGRVNSQMES